MKARENFTVCIYFVDRCYGGPEEGGWWYDAGHPSDDWARFTRGFATLVAAKRYRRSLRHLERFLNKGRPSISSVLSEGEYRACLDEGCPKPFPETRPYYE